MSEMQETRRRRVGPSDEEKLQAALEQFWDDSGNESHPLDIDGVQNEFVGVDQTKKLLSDWKNEMELKVIKI